MPVLSIVVCRMLEDEVAHLLSADEQIRELILVDGIESIRLSAKLKALGRPHITLALPQIEERLTELQKSRSLRPPEGLLSRCLGRLRPKRPGCTSHLTVVASPLRIGLHTSLERLKAAVYDDIRRLSAFSDGILIFYGKCGNSLADLEKDFSDLSCPLYFLADESGERIDDCIAAALGVAHTSRLVVILRMHDVNDSSAAGAGREQAVEHKWLRVTHHMPAQCCQE